MAIVDLRDRLDEIAAQERQKKERESVDAMPFQGVDEQINGDLLWFAKHKVNISYDVTRINITLDCFGRELAKLGMDVEAVNLEIARQLAVAIRMARIEIERKLNQKLAVAKSQVLPPGN